MEIVMITVQPSPAVGSQGSPLFRASLVGEEGVWDDGSTREQAVFNLIRRVPDRVGVSITMEDGVATHHTPSS